MIPARKIPFFVRWFTRQVEKRTRNTFGAVHVSGLDHLQATLDAHPVLVVSNHTAWWDPMLSILACHGWLRADAYAMMDARNLQKLPFLGRVGGYGVFLDDPADRKRVLRYTRDLLKTPGRLVWIFPQGAERPRAAPLDDFKPGAALVARMSEDIRVVPVGIRYEFRNRPKPEAFVSVGAPLSAAVDVQAGVREQQDAVSRQLANIDRYLLNSDETTGFTTVIGNDSSSQSRGWAERILAFVTRYRT